MQTAGATLTLGELRAAIDGLPDSTPVTVDRDDVLAIEATRTAVDLRSRFAER